MFPYIKQLCITCPLLIVACGGGGSESTSSSSVLMDFTAPSDATSLQSVLTTRYTSSNDFELWACASEGTENAVIGLTFPARDTLGAGLLGTEYDLNTGGESVFSWSVLSASQVSTRPIDNDTELLASNVTFLSDDFFRFTNVNSINLNCQRMADSAVFGQPVVIVSAPAAPTEQEGEVTATIQEPEGFASLYAYLSFQNVGGVFRLSDDMVALFDDGSQTNGLETVFNEGVAVSRARNPEQWGRYRFLGSDLQLSDFDDEEFDTAVNNFIAIGGGPDEKLDGCFTNIGSSAFDSIDFIDIDISTFCFDTAGLFTNNTFYSASGIALTVSASNNDVGRYRIDGNAIQLIYANNSEFVASFAFLSDDRTSISINGKRHTR